MPGNGSCARWKRSDAAPWTVEQMGERYESMAGRIVAFRTCMCALRRRAFQAGSG